MFPFLFSFQRFVLSIVVATVAGPGTIALWTIQDVHADGPSDNRTEVVRPIPPVGIEVPLEKRQALLDRCREVRRRFEALRESQTGNPLAAVPSFAADVLVFPRAVEMMLRFDQVYKPADLKSARQLLDLAQSRIERIAEGHHWWTVMGVTEPSDQPRALVSGFRSEIDDSIQPYGLIVPAGFDPADRSLRRLDVWLHGRDERVSEVGFLQRSRSVLGQYQPADTFVLHPFGRYSNAFKFAGETDVFEAMAHLGKRGVPVDPARIAVRGFSMGGAGCWQMATRYADRWFAANPGAGFSETPEFLKFFQGEQLDQIPEYQRRLWQWYDNPKWVRNLKHCPTIVYSGENDRQKQAADVMQLAFDDAGMEMVHILGPNTEHRIHPESKIEIASQLEQIESRASSQPPRRVHLTTFTTRYHQMHWVSVQGLETHWQQATVDAELTDQGRLLVRTENVTALTFNLPDPWRGDGQPSAVEIEIDGQSISAPDDGPLELKSVDGQWQLGSLQGLRKRPGLQGPIDDAFTSRFVFVLPSGTEPDRAVESWVRSESQHAMRHWQKHFRGDVRKVFDHEVDETLMAQNHLIVFGTPQSNAWLAKIADQIPLLGNHAPQMPAGHAPVLVYPNPMNSDRYVVVNSGFTFREYDYLNNARQTPKLPDWAIVDVRSGATPQAPGRIVDAGFFDERWQLPPHHDSQAGSRQ